MKPASPFRRDFTLMVIGQIISLFGNAILRFSLSLHVLSLTGSAAVFGSILALAMVPLMGAVEERIWFFTYHLTLAPVGILAPIFLALGCLIPLGVYRVVARASLVERLRAAEE